MFIIIIVGSDPCPSDQLLLKLLNCLHLNLHLKVFTVH